MHIYIYTMSQLKVFGEFFLCVLLMLMMLLLTSASVHCEPSGGETCVTDKGGTDGAWRSAEALHPIQAEMQPYVRDMIKHAFDSYMSCAFPKDELCSLSGSGMNTFGGYGLTLIDSFDTLAVAGLHKEFRKYAKWVDNNLRFDNSDSLSVFETSIRIIGGLLAAHFMYEEGVVEIVPEEHDYKGGFVRLAADIGNAVISCFNTTTGIPQSSFVYRDGAGICSGKETDAASGGTFLLEMTALSKLTGDDKYERAARRASEALFAARNHQTGLMGKIINVFSGSWTYSESHVSAGIDSAIEYFIKSHTMSGNVGDWERFERTVRSINRYLRKGGMFLAVDMNDGRRAYSVHDALASFFPGTLILGGHHTEAVENVWPIQTIFKYFGALAETFSLSYGDLSQSYYAQRPEHLESLYYLYRATRDPVYLVMGKELAIALNLRLRTKYGFASLNNVRNPHSNSRYMDRMESFMLAETLKYLYLLFDECNVIHVQGTLSGDVLSYCTTVGTEGNGRGSHVGWIFNTEAHLLPNRAEWWAPMAGNGIENDEKLHSKDVRRRRLEVIDGLIDIFDNIKDWSSGSMETDTVSHVYYCANHVITDMDRISKSFFR